MRIAYGTYAMPTVPLEEAFPMLARLGYDGVEIAISDKHHGATPDQMDKERRARLRGLLQDNGLGVPALFVLGAVYTLDESAHRANLEKTRLCVQLARDLGMAEPPVIAIGFGGVPDGWEQQRERLIAQLADYAALAEDLDFILAAEAHSKGAVNCSERVAAVLDAVNHPRVRLHFDIVHFFLGGEDIAQCVARMIPYTAHTHITDAVRHQDQRFDPRLLGEGELDSVQYMRAMKQAGWQGYITLEVSMLIWNQEGYDPERAARQSYQELERAFAVAGVERG